MSVKAFLFSKDRQLAESCRDIFGELLGTEWSLAVGLTADSGSDGDIWIWDFIPGETRFPGPPDPERLRKQFFVVHSEHVNTLRELVGTSHLNVLLKPVTPATLKAFLGEACRQWKERHRSTATRVSTLRAERDEMLQCLIQANLKLQEYDQERTNFLARSIHDFRAPLTAINGYCVLLLEEQLGAITAEQREILERVEHSARRLSGMADAMFQLSIAQKVKQPQVFQETDIRECVDQALHEVTPMAAGKRISIVVDIQPPPEPLFLQRPQLQQVLVNLLDNACKFTPRAGSIEVKGYPFFWDRRMGQAAQLDPSADRRVRQVSTANSFRLDLRDSGPGIPAIYLDKIFEEYTSYRGGQDRSGGGLGLAICKMIIQQHQGRIWAESEPGGAVFSFVLPCRRTEVCLAGQGFQKVLQAVAH